jgi:hypothetical protein
VLMGKDLRESVLARAPASAHWYDDTWDVQSFVRNGADVPPLITDKTRWKRIRLETYADKSYVRWRNMDESYGALYTVAYDQAQHSMTWTSADPAEGGPAERQVYVFQVAHLDVDRMTLAGHVGSDELEVQLTRLEVGKLLLVSRGFHWINEVPFNR